ncbi:MAG: DoxX family protein [Phycisphaerales bacterium]
MNKFPTNADLGLLMIRVMLGVVGVFHGAQKLFGLWGGHGIRGTAGFMESLGLPAPTLAAIAAGSAEFFGGLMVALGLFSRIAALFFAFTMFVAVALVHRGSFASPDGMEYPLTLGVVLLALAVAGPGKYAITKKI